MAIGTITIGGVRITVGDTARVYDTGEENEVKHILYDGTTLEVTIGERVVRCENFETWPFEITRSNDGRL